MKILVICEHFAPQTGAQALQATKVVDALHDAGCEVRVLCGERQDESRSHRYEISYVAPRSYGNPKSVAGRALRRLRYEFDALNVRGEWVREMTARAVEISNVFKPDVIVTQSTPFRAHLVGLNLPLALRDRWVTYFSDLWPLSLAPRPYRTRISDLLRPVQLPKLIEVISASRCSIFTNEVSINRLLDAWPDADSKRFHVVAHIGSPPRSHESTSELASHYAGRFVHVGKLTRERACSQLVDAIAQCQSTSEREIGWFPGFTFVGDVDPAFRRSCAALEQIGVVDFTGNVEPAIAQAISRVAGALVVIEAPMDESPFLASKFADYALLDKPILAITARGPIREFLTKYGGGVAVGHNTSEIQAAIKSFAAPGGLKCGASALADQFDAGNVARQYLEIFRCVA